MTVQPSINSRFRVVERPVAAPGKCIVCGSTDRECIDFGMDIDDYGAVYFCFDCMREGALATQRVVTVERYDAERMKAGQSVDSYLREHNLRAVTNEFAATVGNLVSSLPTAFPDLHVHLGDDDSESVDEAYGHNGQELQPDATESVHATGQDDEPTGKRGPASVPTNTVFEPLL